LHDRTQLTHEVEGLAPGVPIFVRIHFIRGHLIGARLAVADRCVSQQLQLLVRVRRRTCPLRNRHRSADQCQQSYRGDQFSHDGSLSWGPSRFMVAGRLDHKVRQTSRFVQMLQAAMARLPLTVPPLRSAHTSPPVRGGIIRTMRGKGGLRIRTDQRFQVSRGRL
jgi:hypothetical protein